MVFLSIVIPVYNAGWIIEKCLDSIWSQGLLEEEYEVVCVNDNSTDNTLEVLDEIAHEHKNLRVVSNTENLRAGGARNRGVREAQGEYILFIDADDYYHAGGLKKAFDYQKEHRLDILCVISQDIIQMKKIII
ncbi:MAG: glycosyltransferase family 2 protein [Paludibacteraceae bacterium]|nr:glycosyltransferase family 2 protein [Paludibacteraceae bacterium]